MSTPCTIGGRNWKQAKARALTSLQDIADEAMAGSVRPHTAADRMLAVASLAVQAQRAVVRLANIAGVEVVGVLGQLREIADEAVAGVKRPSVAGERMLIVLTLARAVEAAMVEMTAAAENGG